MTSAPVTSIKRKMEDILVDPDTVQPIEDAKKPKIDLNANRKFQCISAIVEMYKQILILAFTRNPTPSHSSMDIDTDPGAHFEDASNNITVGNYIISIIYTIHNVCRQETKQTITNMIKKTSTTSYKIHYKNQDYPLDNNKIKENWVKILKRNDLEYKDFPPSDSKNWYGTMRLCLDMFSSYALRVNELRLGHNNMAITKIDGVTYKSFPVSKYGLSGAHHVLLEGVSFPPERRSSIVQSIGPMTAWLCMIRSEGIYRKKHAAAVKRAMSHVPCIDDMIKLTENNKQASEIAKLTTLVAEILLVTTSRQATRMFFPITLFAAVWDTHVDKKRFCEFFSTTGAGGWYTYKCAANLKNRFSINGKMESEKASQIVFHGIFGTYKEDLTILSQITDISLWFTRQEMGTCFRQQSNSEESTKVQLPIMRFYGKISCANQTGLLSGEYNQVVTVPCFSGYRTHKFDATFFEHIEKKRILSYTVKSLSQIINILMSTLEELHNHVKKEGGKIDIGTTNWGEMASLDLGVPGAEVQLNIERQNKMFFGKN